MSVTTASTVASVAAPVTVGAATVSSAAQVAAVAALSEAQALARLRVLANASAYLLRLLGAFRGWYDEEQVLRWAVDADATMRRTQQTSADLTLNYQRQILARLGVGLSRAEQLRARFVVPGPDEPNLRGIDFLTEWERPVKEYRYGRSVGDSHAQAFARAEERLRALADAEEQMAAKRAERRALTVAAGLDPDAEDAEEQARRLLAEVEDTASDLADPERLDGRSLDGLGGQAAGRRVRVVATRRILHPERTKSGPCGLCVVAADRLYTVAELQPLHDGCECTTAPVTEVDGKVNDPGLSLNRADLDRLYEAAGGTGRDLLARTRVRVDEHGELGPVLVLGSAKKRDAERARNASRNPGESEIDKARRLRDFAESQVNYLQGLVDAGQSKYAVTLSIQRRLLRQRTTIVNRLQRQAA